MRKFLWLILLLPPFSWPMNEPRNRISLEITDGEEIAQEIRVEVKRRPHTLERTDGFYIERHKKRKAFIRGLKKIGSAATKIAMGIVRAAA